MNITKIIIIFIILFTTCNCVRNFTPNIQDYDEVLVVEALITDQPEINTVKLSVSNPLWNRIYPEPLRGFIVTVSDDLGQVYTFHETSANGIYASDTAEFRGVAGREYTLHIKTNSKFGSYSYESVPMKMIPVPPIDSLYFEKKVIDRPLPAVEGCDIYLNTYDPTGDCRFYKWEYAETWEFQIPFDFANKVCWISNNSEGISIKNAAIFSEDRINRQPVLSINNPVDRLSIKYSVLVKQFSLSEDEYIYWERLQNSREQTGGIYDIIPATIPNNIFCVENTYKKVLGFFSVSAMSSKRLFIKDNFIAVNNMYSKCLNDTVFTNKPDTVPALAGGYYWVVENHINDMPPYLIYTFDFGCVDCTARGTAIKPDFWDDDK